MNELGIDKIDSMTLMSDPKDPNCNRGFAFLDFETNKDAQIAFKKLQKKDAFGKGRIVKVAWAEPINDPDEEEMQKVPFFAPNFFRVNIGKTMPRYFLNLLF